MRQDIALDDDFKLVFERGDFKVSSSDDSHAALVFVSHPGEFKAYPLRGFGAASYLKKSRLIRLKIKRDLALALEHDGYKNLQIEVDENFKITIDL